MAVFEMHTALEFLARAGVTDEQLVGLKKIGYFSAPASCRHHLAESGGLVAHSINVTRNLINLKVFPDPAGNPSTYRVGMLHDLVKCFNYAADGVDGKYRFTSAPYPGHGMASFMIAHELGIELTPVEAACIVWHMGAFGLDEDALKQYSAAVRLYPNQIILTHAADHLASVHEELREKI